MSDSGDWYLVEVKLKKQDPKFMSLTVQEEMENFKHDIESALEEYFDWKDVVIKEKAK